jgi:hypothetical protein
MSAIRTSQAGLTGGLPPGTGRLVHGARLSRVALRASSSTWRKGYVGRSLDWLAPGEAVPLACQAAAQPVQQSQQALGGLGAEGGYWRAGRGPARGEQVAGA